MSKQLDHTQNPVTLFDVTSDAGLEPQPAGGGEKIRFWCPTCEAEGRPRAGKSRNAWGYVDSGRWFCASNRDSHGGWAGDIAGDRPLSDIPRRRYIAPVPEGDIGALWQAAGDHQPDDARLTISRWAETVRGWDGEAAYLAGCWSDFRVVGPELGKVEKTIGRSLAKDKAHPIIAALRNPAGEVQSLVRCWDGQGEKPDVKRKALASRFVGAMDCPTYGSIPYAVDAAKSGRPVFITEGLPDTVAAYALTRSVYGECVGTYTAQGAARVGKALAGQLEAAGVSGATVYLLVQEDECKRGVVASHGWRDALVEALAGSQSVHVVDLAEVKAARGVSAKTFDVADLLRDGGELAELMAVARVADRVVERVEAVEAVEAAGLPEYLLPGRAAAIFDAIEAPERDRETLGVASEPTGPRGPGDEAPPKPWTPSTGRIPTDMRRAFGLVLDRGITDGRYLRADVMAEADGFPCVMMRCPTGTGKTHSIAAELRRLTAAERRDLRVLSISHRRTLVGELRTRLELSHTHLTASGEVEITQAKCRSLAVCADSISAVWRQVTADHEFDGIDVLVLDESESTMAHVHTCQRGPVARAGIFDALRNLCRASTKIIAADATLSAFTVEALAELVGLDVPDLLERSALIEDRRNRSSLSPLDVVWLDRGADAAMAARQMASDSVPFFYHAGSKARARAIHRECAELSPDRRWVLITGDHDDESGAAFLADPNGWIEEHRGKIGGVIYTAALESGVSIDVQLGEVADSVIVEAEGHQTWQQVIQAASRARRAGRWLIHAPTAGKAAWLDRDELARALLEGREDSTAGVTKIARGGWTMPDAWRRHREARDAEHFAAYVRARVHGDLSRVRLGLDLWAYLSAEGYVIRHPDREPADLEAERKAVGQQLAERRDEIKAEKIAEVVAADDSGLTVAEAQAVLDGSGDVELRPAAYKRTVREFYGCDPTEAVVEFDDGGKGRSSIARWVELAAMLYGNHESVQAADEVEIDVAAGATERTRRTVVAWAVLSAFGVTPEMAMGAAKGRIHLDANDEEEELIRLHIDAEDHARVWSWVSDRRIRDAVKLAVGCDAWRQIPKADRARVVDALKAAQDGASEGVTGVDSYKEKDPTRYSPVELPEGHTLNRLLTMAAKRLGLVIRSRLVREGGEVYRALFFDVQRSRMIRELSGAHYARMTGSELPSLDRETAEDVAERHTAELNEMIERVDAGWSEPEEIDELLLRHAIEVDAVVGVAAGAPVQPDSAQIDRLIELGDLYDWRGCHWERRSSDIPILDDEALYERLIYLAGQAVSAGLVRRAVDWPGVPWTEAVTTGRPLVGVWYDRSKLYRMLMAWFARPKASRGRRPTLADVAETRIVVLTPPPMWADLSPEVQRLRWLGVVDAAEARCPARGRVLGRAGILRVRPHDHPEKSKRSPAPAVHASSRAQRIGWRAAYSAFVDSYRSAMQMLRAGIDECSFPPEGCRPVRMLPVPGG